MKLISNTVLACVILLISMKGDANTILGFATVDSENGITHSYNSAGSGVHLISSNPRQGRYKIMFSSLVNHNSVGYWQVVRIGKIIAGRNVDQGYCKVQSIQVTGGTTADIQCYTIFGDTPESDSPHHTNQPFQVLFLADSGDSEPDRNMAYFRTSQPTEEHTELSRYQGYNADREAISLRRNERGHYTATIPDFSFREESGGNVQLSAYGRGNTTCTVHNWIASEIDSAALEIDVKCFEPKTGLPRDSRFQALVLYPKGIPADFAYTYSTHSGDAVPHTLVNYYTHTSVESGSIKRWNSTRLSDSDHIGITPFGNAFGTITLITPRTNQPRVCQVESTEASSTDPTPATLPFTDLIINPRCDSVESRHNYRARQTGFSLLSISPTSLEPTDTIRYILNLEILRIQETTDWTCDDTAYVAEIQLGQRENFVNVVSETVELLPETSSVEPGWKWSVLVHADPESQDLPRLYINLKKTGRELCSQFQADPEVDITPALEQKNLTLEIDFKTHRITSIDEDWYFMGFFHYGYVGRAITVTGNEPRFYGSTTFRITLDRI